jgi:hypothetical protein
MGRTLGQDIGATVLNQDIYEISATQKHRLGTRVVRGDRVFRYAKAITTMTVTSQLAYSYYRQLISYAAIATASPIGSNKIYVTVGAGDGIAADGVIAEHSLEGGYVVIFDGGTAAVYNFAIKDNNAAVSGGTITITLDGELPIATTATTDIVELMGNPYMVATGTQGYMRPFMGLPTRLLTTTYPYGWLQTWGPCFLVCQPDVGVSTNANNLFNDVVARHDGTGDIATYNAGDVAHAQRIGYVLSFTVDGTSQAAPFVFLQIAP